MWEKVTTKRICKTCGLKMRWFDGLSLGVILHELKHEKPAITRSTFLRYVRQGKLTFPSIHKNAGGWRIFNRTEADEIKSIIRKDARIE